MSQYVLGTTKKASSYLLSFIFYLLSFIFYLLSFIFYLLKTNPWSDDGDGTWSRTYTYSDFHIKSISPGIGEGSRADTVFLTNSQPDIWGDTMFFAPFDILNIGVDQHYSSAGLRPTDAGTIIGGGW
jgi:hypothetical protein